MKKLGFIFATAWAVAGLCQATESQLAGDRNYAIVVTSAAGEPEFKEKFWDWASRMDAVLKTQLGFPRDNVFLLFEDATKGPIVTARSTKKDLATVFDRLVARQARPDLLFVFLIGHASFDGAEYKFNLVGPDLTGSELGKYLDQLGAGQVVLVAGTPASGVLTRTLSAKGRVILAATKSEFENNQVLFPGFFVEAFEGQAGDSDKNRRVSVSEAYLYARQKVEAWYKEKGQLATEHAVLEDNGDRKGSPVPSPENGDGLLAQKIAFGSAARPGTDRAAAGTSKSGNGALLAKKKQLEDEIADLKYKKDSLPATEYQSTLERLLLELAKTNRELKTSE